MSFDKSLTWKGANWRNRMSQITTFESDISLDLKRRFVAGVSFQTILANLMQKSGKRYFLFRENFEWLCIL